ncbi:MAG: hypothetical protein B7Y57_16105 [Rhodospirillales bacterium 35-66-84]|nr:MAG: hypothetical protein B7Y57_16105 [Rhodospirillales bacterium 35-66-84]
MFFKPGKWLFRSIGLADRRHLQPSIGSSQIDGKRISAHFANLPINLLAFVGQTLNWYPVVGQPLISKLFRCGVEVVLDVRH